MKLKFNARAILLLFVVSTMFLLNSCRKEDHQNETTNSFNTIESSKLSELKLWYELNKQQVIHKDNWLNTFSPDWDRIKVSQNDGLDVYEIAVENPKRIFASSSNIDTRNIEKFQNRSALKLMIFRDSYGVYKACFMELIATEKNTQPQLLRYKDYGELSGFVNFYELNGTLANGWIYTNGKITGSTDAALNKGLAISSKNNNSGSESGKLMYKVAVQCGTVNIPHWRETCVSTDGIDGYGGGGYRECSWEMYYTTEPVYCDDSGGSGGYGGTSGGSGDPANITDDLAAYPCAKALVASMPNLKSDMAARINAMFSKNDQMNIHFRASTTLPSTFDGMLNSTGNPYGNVRIYTIDINSNVLTKASKEYILVTMYHEAMHAYLMQKRTELGAAQFAIQFEGFEVNGGRLIPKDIEHTTMAYQNYLDGLAGVITAFNPSFGANRAMALAKMGIVNLTNAEKAVNAQERDTTVPGYTGTKCP